MSRGNALELGIRHAGAHYRAQRRAAVLKQEIRRRWNGEVVGGAPVDFVGVRDGRALVIEAKETEKSYFEIFNEKVITPSQIKACDELLACGAEVWLVIDFTTPGEAYALPWADIAAFIASPWHGSLSLDFCRAYGLLLPETHRADPKRRQTLFLDGAQHPDAAVCLARVNAARSAARDDQAPTERTPRANKRQLELAARSAARPHPSDREAHKQYVLGLMAEGIERQVGERAQANRRARAMDMRKHHGGGGQ